MPYRRPTSLRWLPAVLCIGLVRCADPPNGPEVRLTSAEAPGGGGGPKVRRADPPDGEQTQTLAVRVIGSGFEPGSVAEWQLAGAASPDVVTNSTQFVSERELLSTITISGTAPLERYDIAVTTPRGKKGVGIELFEVKSTGTAKHVLEPATYVYQDQDLHSDGDPVYRDEDACDTRAVIQTDTVTEESWAAHWLTSTQRPHPICRRVLVRLDEQVDPETGITTAASPTTHRVNNLAIHVEGPSAGQGKIMIDYCLGHGRGMRFNPDPETFGIEGSTRLRVDTLELGRSWRVYSDETTIAGCWVDVQKGVGIADTTFWRVELDFVVTKDPVD